MIKKIQLLWKQLNNNNNKASTKNTFELSVASLLCEVANVDHIQDEHEITVKCNQLMSLLDISETNADKLLHEAQTKSESSVSVYPFTTVLKEIEYKQRYLLIEAMWAVAYADNIIDPYEEGLIRQVSELIYLTHTDFIKAKLAAQGLRILTSLP